MLTSEQLARLKRFRDDDRVEVVPFDPTSLKRFEKLKSLLASVLGENVDIQLRGSSFLGISGKGELDVYIPVEAAKFDETVAEVEAFLNCTPKSLYPLDRARFVTFIGGKEDEVFVVNQDGKSWSDSLIFENYLLSHPDSLQAYEELKLSNAGLSTRAYYTAKEEFINGILTKAGS